MIPNIFAFIVVMSALITASLIIALWSYRKIPGIGYFILVLVAGTVYSVFYALEVASFQFSYIWFFYRLEYLGIPYIPAFYLFFVISYSGQKHKLSIPFRISVLMVPVITTLMVITNDCHHFFLTDSMIYHNGFFHAFAFSPGIWYCIHQIYTILVFLLSFIILFRMWLRSSQVFRLQTGIILICTLIPFVVYLAYLLKVFPWGLDPVPFSSALMAAVVYIGLSQYNLFSMAPMARNLLFDKLPDSVLVFDLQNRLVDLNNAAKQLFGITSKDVGKNLEVLFLHYPEVIHVIQTNSLNHQFEFQILQNDTPRNFSITSSQLIDYHGNELGKMVIVHDITERRLAEKRRRESEERFRLIVENAPLGVIYFDKEGIIRICNDELVRIIGSSREKLIGLNMMKLPDQHIVSSLKTALEGNKAKMEGIYKSVTADKTTPVRVIFETIVSDSGEVTGGIGVVEDITDRLEAEEKIRTKNIELERTNAEKDRFFSIIAHDLRSPFNAFLGFTELMTDESFELTMDEMRSYAREIRKSALLLFGLLENLLEWSRLQRKELFFEKYNYPLIRLVNQSVETLAENAAKKEIRIINNVHPDIQVLVDEKMIQSVFRNLISNAIKFTYRGGKVTIEANANADNMIEVQVTDTGVGIKSSEIEKLFRIDEDYSTCGTEGEPSTGLGLILCREFVEKHGGKIWVNSQQGIGSTFYFTLPAKKNIKFEAS